jgi:hypothetical protein
LQVQQTIEWSVKFAGLVSPWWMLPAMLLAVAVALGLYRQQGQGLPRWQLSGLKALRVVILLTLIFVAFKPSLIMRRILTYPGRILMVLDDSASMTAHDTALSDAGALRLARRLGMLAASPASAPDALAQNLNETITALRAFEIFSRTADRKQDHFWDQAGLVRRRLNTLLDGVARDMAALPGVKADEKSRLEAGQRSLLELKGSLDVFFSGDRDPGVSAYGDFERRVTALSQELLTLQSGWDDRAIASGDLVLKAAAAKVRATPRMDLVRAKLARLQPSLSKLAPGQNVQMVSLMTLHRWPGKDFRPAELQVREGPTDITGSLNALLAEPSEFPLSALMLISDGRNLSEFPLRKVIQESVSRQVPLFTAGVGSEREPNDLALVSVRSPAFAVKGDPMRIKVEIRNSMATTDVGRLQVFLGGVPVVSDSVNLAPGVQTALLEFTPADTGFFKYTVRIDSVPGEVFPVENNSLDFITNVRDDKIRVLFLDWKPRWESRFALNILQRLPYVDLNAIMALVQEGAQLPRGLIKGTWPETAEALAMYDVVILGDLPDNLLKPTDLEAVKQWVQQKGKTLCWIGAGPVGRVGSGSGMADLIGVPSLPGTGTVTRAGAADPDDLQLTPVGRTHVLSRALAESSLFRDRTNTVDMASNGSVVLAGEGNPALPLMMVRYSETGKLLGLFNDDLWRQLHPLALEAHTELYAGLVTWAVEGGFKTQAAGQPAVELAVDARRFPPGSAVQVWLRGGLKNAVIEAVRGNDVIASSEAASMGPGVPACALFPNLSPGEVVFKVRGQSKTQSERIEVFADKRERISIARDTPFLREAAGSTGARHVEFSEVETCFQTIVPRQRTETRERVWRLWGWGPLLGVLILAMTAQWIWRKWVGLV